MIIESFDVDLKLFLAEIETLGFRLCIVGGYPRDFLYLKTKGIDLDFEIRAREFVDKKEWPTFYKKLHSFLDAKKIKYKELPYLITSIEFGEYKLEFSSPRTEMLIENNLSHHHFTPILDSNLSWIDSFKRRDFTINAIGFELNLTLNNEIMIDPYNGLKDLKEGLLKNISDDFFNDSVRFLRLIRFKIKFNAFVLDKKLIDNLHLFRLEELSIYHFNTELFKSKPGKFLRQFKTFVLLKSLSLPKTFKIWLKYDFSEELKTREEILAFVFIHNESDAKEVLDFFSMPEKKMRDLKSFFNSYEFVKKINDEKLKKLMAMPLEEILGDEVLRELKNLDDKKEWRKNLSINEHSLLISWNDWEKTIVTPEELSAIKLPLRSYYRFYKAILGKLKND